MEKLNQGDVYFVETKGYFVIVSTNVYCHRKSVPDVVVLPISFKCGKMNTCFVPEYMAKINNLFRMQNKY